MYTGSQAAKNGKALRVRGVRPSGPARVESSLFTWVAYYGIPKMVFESPQKQSIQRQPQSRPASFSSPYQAEAPPPKKKGFRKVGYFTMTNDATWSSLCSVAPFWGASLHLGYL